MDSKTMLEREPFKEVLVQTIDEYFREVEGKKIYATVTEQNNSVPLYIFLKPFFVSCYPFPHGLSEYLYSEYNIRGNLLEYLIGKVGVLGTLHSGTTFAKDRIYISSEAKNEGFFIGPCNRTVRFYYYDKDYVDIIVKNGYQSDFLKKQIQFRKTVDLSFVPKLLAYGETWYREKIMHGHALARTRNNILYDGALKQIEGALSVLSEINKEYVSSLEYFDNMKNKAIELLKSLDQKSTECLKDVFQRIKVKDMPIPLSVSHGDLQSGNIWVNTDGKITIYDWETVHQRSVWFDPMVLYGRLHSGCFTVNIFQVLMQDKRIFNDDYKGAIYSADDIRTIEIIVAMEDLVFCLMEASQLLSVYAQKRANLVVESFIKYFEVNANE